MKSHELLEAVGGIDESFVQECLEEEKEKNLPEKKKNKWLKWGLAGVTLLAVAAVVILIFRRKELTEEEILRLPVSPSEGCFVYDPGNAREAVGYADYVFTGKLVSYDGVHYDHTIPLSEYTVQVLENIKGSLVTSRPIHVVKDGGVMKDHKSVSIWSGDSLPESGKTYIFLGSAGPDGTIMISGPNSNVEITGNDPKIEEYKDAYKNEVVYERERYRAADGERTSKDSISDNKMSDKLGVSMDMSIAEHYHTDREDVSFSAAESDVLQVSEENGLTSVYAWVFYAEYSFEGGSVKEEYSEGGPVVIIFDTSSGGSNSTSYKVTEFWEPGEGDSFEEDIKARFPQILWDRALDMTVIDSLREKCIEQAWDYHEEMHSENVLYIPGPISDYVATEQKDLNKLADVVLIGTVKEEKGTYVGTNLLPITGVKVKVEKLFKGDAKGDADELNVEYYGGKVPFPEYAAGMTKEQIKKAFPDLEEEQYANTMVSLNDELSIHAHLEKERTYLFFLSYDEEKNTYFVLCGGYGAREYDGENVYDPDLKKYVPIKLQ